LEVVPFLVVEPYLEGEPFLVVLSLAFLGALVVFLLEASFLAFLAFLEAFHPYQEASFPAFLEALVFQALAFQAFLAYPVAWVAFLQEASFLAFLAFRAFLAYQGDREGMELEVLLEESFVVALKMEQDHQFHELGQIDLVVQK